MKVTLEAQQAKECFDKLPKADQQAWLDFTRRLQEAQRERLERESRNHE